MAFGSIASTKIKDKRSHTAGSEQWAAASFPQDLGIHYMHFEFFHQQFQGRNREPTKIGRGSVQLPIPTNLIDIINLQYNDAELGMLGGGIANWVASADDKVTKVSRLASSAMGMTVGEIATNVASSLGETGKAALEKMQADLASGGELTSGAFRAGTDPLAVGLNRMFGNVPNPNLITMFRGVGLRSHSFEWKLAPRNENESRMLAKIVKIFKHSALPGRHHEHKRSLLTFPYEVHILIIGSSKIAESALGGKNVYDPLITFKPVIIKSVTANYTPDNTPSFFARTGHPTAVLFRLEFQETQIHTREDYGDISLFENDLWTGPTGFAEMPK